MEKWLRPFITNERTNVNYTKIGNQGLNIFGNKYSIPDDRVKDFYETYKKHVFEDHQDAYLTEKQLDKGKILIDLDFRYDDSVSTKQHSPEHVDDFIETILNIMNTVFDKVQGKQIKFYIFEKENVNQCENKTKDGIHIIINVLCDYPTKMLLRDFLISELPDIWDDLPLTNTWKDVVDETVMKGHANWQLYGSKKPGGEAYKLKYVYESKITNEIEVDYKKIDMTKLHFDSLFPRLCARDVTDCHDFPLQESLQGEYEKYKQEFQHKKQTKSLKRKITNACKSVAEVKSTEDLEAMIRELHEDTNIDHKVKEVHAYTMCLPKDYWGPGSYSKWIRVGWALRNTSEKLLLTWMLFCSQSEDFDFRSNDAAEHWENFDVYNKEGLSQKSIMYWAKMDNYPEYIKIYHQTVDYYIYQSFKTNTECDLATTLYHMYKDQYVCVSIKDNIWYEFTNNRWYPIDSGSTLRLKISTDMYNQYTTKLLHYQSTNQAKQNNMMIQDGNANDSANQVISDSSNDDFGDYKKKVNEMLATCKLLKKTNTKNNIMREARELFYDRDFTKKLDTNAYLLGCNNCVIDFKGKLSRKGKHDDYLSKSTGLNYMPLSHYERTCPEIIQQINEFMAQLFPNEDANTSMLRDYMWEHLASTTMGTNENQTFNIYTGSGANGKSKLVELMKEVLNEYQGTVPISLITQKRSNIGGTSSEVHNLIGIRYAVMQEPTKGDKINEGIMKEVTGGDEIQCRALFKDSVTFRPQFKLVVCTNTLFDVMSNDDGTWRRLRIVDFQSKFTKSPYKDKQFPEEEYPHQFKVDQKINEKFKIWAPVLLSMLVDVAYRTQGFVNDVAPVVSATEKYRASQDVLTQFYSVTFVPSKPNNPYGIKLKELHSLFDEWIQNHDNGAKRPSKAELKLFVEKKTGQKYSDRTGWKMISVSDDQTPERDHPENDLMS